MNYLKQAKIEIMIEDLLEHRNFLLDCFLVKQAAKITETIEELKSAINGNQESIKKES